MPRVTANVEVTRTWIVYFDPPDSNAISFSDSEVFDTEAAARAFRDDKRSQGWLADAYRRTFVDQLRKVAG